MAKVEINLPGDLLRRIDRVAERAGVTRDELLRRIVEDEATRSEAAFREEVEAMLGPPVPMGGNAAEILPEMRDGHPPVRRGDSDGE